MSTNATIRIKYQDGKTKGIYLHYDGYIEGAGVTLQLAYNTGDKVKELIELGDLSQLDYTIADCEAYCRDRGESMNFTNNDDNEFVYEFDEEEQVWYVTESRMINKEQQEQIAMLGFNYVEEKHKSLLITAIAECEQNIEKWWKSDDYAEKGKVYEACCGKALEARAEIMRKNAEEYNAFYSAYCD